MCVQILCTKCPEDNLITFNIGVPITELGVKNIVYGPEICLFS